jgi:hypothetical protein
VYRQPRVGQPIGDVLACRKQYEYATEAKGDERNERVGHVPAGLRRRQGHEVIEALRHAELRQAKQRRVDQEQLLVGAELCRIEDARQHQRDREGDHQSGHAAGGQHARGA